MMKCDVVAFRRVSHSLRYQELSVFKYILFLLPFIFELLYLFVLMWNVRRAISETACPPHLLPGQLSGA